MIFDMNVKETRKRRLVELTKIKGTLQEVAAHVIASEKTLGKGKALPKSKYLDRYLSNINTGIRGMGSRFARRLEVAFGKPEGWMDRMGATSAESNDLLSVWGQFPEEEQHRIVEELKIRLRVIKNKTFIIQEVGEIPPARYKPHS